MKSIRFHPGISHPESLRGDQIFIWNLTLGIARDLPARSCGFHRFEPVHKCNRLHFGQCYLPDKEFRYLRTVQIVTHLFRDGLDRFRPVLHVAMKVGLSHPSLLKVWRIVSEDS